MQHNSHLLLRRNKIRKETRQRLLPSLQEDVLTEEFFK